MERLLTSAPAYLRVAIRAGRRSDGLHHADTLLSFPTTVRDVLAVGAAVERAGQALTPSGSAEVFDREGTIAAIGFVTPAR